MHDPLVDAIDVENSDVIVGTIFPQRINLNLGNRIGDR
jgi:hypothetical protein